MIKKNKLFLEKMNNNNDTLEFCGRTSGYFEPFTQSQCFYFEAHRQDENAVESTYRTFLECLYNTLHTEIGFFPVTKKKEPRSWDQKLADAFKECEKRRIYFLKCKYTGSRYSRRASAKKPAGFLFND